MTPTLRILRDPDALADAACEHIAEVARAAIDRSGRFVFALAGGSTPRRTYGRLVSALREDDWARTHVFFGDERCVPSTADGSNYRMARETLLDAAPIPAANVHRIRGELGPVEAAADYERVLAAFFGAPMPAAATASTFDLVLLGLGPDGHTASLFPGSAALDDARWAAPSHAPPGVSPADRVTVTLATLATASEALFLVAGTEKRDAVARVLGTDPDTALPAALVRPHRSLVWLLDRDSGPGSVAG